MRPGFGLFLGFALPAAVFLVTSAIGSFGYFHFADPARTCNSCHEMSSQHAEWSVSAHRTLHCRECHGGSLTLDVHALTAHVNRVVQHFGGGKEQPIRLTEQAIHVLQDSCRDCHPQSYADWQSSRHSAGYARIFLDPAQNGSEHPEADCLRCHGMFFDGEIHELVTPLDTTGPWTLKDPAKAAQPTIPCLACHRIHTPAAAAPAEHLQFYDRRERTAFAASLLPAPAILQGDRRVEISADPRQRLCVQCHAPTANHQLGTSDDRTPAGVHEGLSCLDCHNAHSNSAALSCRSCHPANSHCGIDVEVMDTSFRSRESKHDIHRVACGDCHEGQRPGKN